MEKEILECPKCKREVIEGEKYCMRCGYKLSLGDRGLSTAEQLGLKEEGVMLKLNHICGVDLEKETKPKISSVLKLISEDDDLQNIEKVYMAYKMGEMILNPFSILQSILKRKDGE